MSRPEPLAEWVFFDVDQTLCDFNVMMRRALARTVTEIERRWPGARSRNLTPEMLQVIRDQVAIEEGRVAGLVAVRHLAFVRTLQGITDDDHEVREITDFYLEHRYADPIVFDDVRPALEQCRVRFRLGTLTNGNSAMDSLGLHDLFEHEFRAESLGMMKPDRAIFDHVREGVGAEPHQMIMIGDSYANDVQGPREAGWRALLLDRDAPSRPGESIRSLLELPDALCAINL